MNQAKTERCVLAIDQGTTGTTALVLDLDGTTRGRATREFPQHFPQPGWVEHEPNEIWASVCDAIAGALETAGIPAEAIAAIGITNQRETTLMWDRKSGDPVHRALVWQDRRTATLCEGVRAGGHEERIRTVTGLVIDPYFSASKVRWLLDADGTLRRRAEGGDIAFGTIDSFLIERLTAGAAPHSIEVTNASRTLLMDLRTRAFSPEMCAIWDIPEAVLPRIVPSAGIVGTTRGVPGLPDGIPIAGIAGDQHAALFGQACFSVGDAKCTYGTGAFILVNTGDVPLRSNYGLLTTLGWQIGEDVVYALEGSCFIAGAAVQWLRDGLGIIQSASEIEALARSVPSSEGVSFVPALSGLGAPHWDADARGLLCGLTRGTTRAHIARATLDAIALQVDDLVQGMGEDLRVGRALGDSVASGSGSTGSSGVGVEKLRVDGGAAANDFLMQLQADYSGIVVERPVELETTARGAAMLAALGAGLFDAAPAPRGSQEVSSEARRTGKAGATPLSRVAQMTTTERTFHSELDDSARQSVKKTWSEAVFRSRSSTRPSS